MPPITEGNSLNRIEKETRARFARRERNRKGRKRPFATTDLGRRVLGQIIPPLADYIASGQRPPPHGLETVARQVPHDELALIAVAALLNKIDTGWNPKDKSARLKICLAIGNDLRDQLEVRRLLEECPDAHTYVMHAKSRQRAILRFRRLDWSQPDLTHAGGWLLDCAVCFSDFFELDERRFPRIAPEHQAAVDRLREELIDAYPYYLPLLAPPPDWKSWRTHYERRISATFVRDNHPDMVAEIKAAFADGSMKQHVDGVNAIQRVPFVINEAMLPVVRALALELARAKAGGGSFDEEMTSNLIKADLGTAEFLAKRGRFWTPCSIDTRGRVYGVPHFNFWREDHVRSLFMFAKGDPIGDAIRWLEVAVTNHFGIKGTWDVRRAWAADNRELIRAVAADPIGTFDRWRKASDPFSFVAACMELSAAEKSRSYETRFPVLLDGSCNGIQHLALMTRDREAGRLVNLTDADEIFDLYKTVEDGVRERLKASDDDEARWWLARDRLSRALIKTPAMAFSYGITESGAMGKIVDEYKRLLGWEDGLGQMAYYLACLVRQVSHEMLPRPAAAMEYMRGLADYCTEQGKALHWISPTGLPIGNRYYKSNTSTVEMKIRGVRVRYRVADGWSSEIIRREARNSAAANFVHSRDAAHLIRSVNGAVSDDITNLVCVHDCFGTTAPCSQRFQHIIRRELALMYAGRAVRYASSGEGLGAGLAPPEDPRWRQPPSLSHNPLAQLRAWNAGEDYPPPPEQGTLDPIEVTNAEYTFK